MKKLDDKGITTCVIRQKGYMPAFTMPATGHNWLGSRVKPRVILWKSLQKCKIIAYKETTISSENLKEVWPMTALRQSAIMELEKIPEDKLSFVIQIMQGVNGLYNDSNKERKDAFARLEQLRKKGIVTDDDAELASYREDKYGR